MGAGLRFPATRREEGVGWWGGSVAAAAPTAIAIRVLTAQQYDLPKTYTGRRGREAREVSV